VKAFFICEHLFVAMQQVHYSEFGIKIAIFLNIFKTLGYSINCWIGELLKM